jgi:hypothetical protein
MSLQKYWLLQFCYKRARTKEQAPKELGTKSRRSNELKQAELWIQYNELNQSVKLGLPSKQANHFS